MTDLNKLMAEVVMGWHSCHLTSSPLWKDHDGWMRDNNPGHAMAIRNWNPLENISHAIECDAAIFKKNKFELSLHRRRDGSFSAMYSQINGSVVTDWHNNKNPATAICKAIAEVIGGKAK